MIKKASLFAAFFLFLLQGLTLLCSAAGGEITVSAKSAVLMNADTLEVLYAKSENEQRPMASTTKIMTALLALEYGQPQLTVTASDEAVRVEGTSIGLLPGDKITLETLIYGMLLESGNDAANVTAQALSGSIESFCVLMNSRARELGMNNTSFKNPSGLPSDGHYSTALDMARLAAFAIKQPLFLKICSKISEQVSFGTPESKRTFSNHNKLLSMYDGALGIKTGFTKSSGRCLVSAAKRNGITLVAVTLNAPDDWNDHIRLFDYGFDVSGAENVQLDLSGVSVAVTGSAVPCVGVYAEKAYCAVPVGCSVELYTEHFLYAPVAGGDTVGYGVIKHANGTEISRFSLFSDAAAPLKPTQSKRKFQKGFSFIERLKNIFKGCRKANS